MVKGNELRIGNYFKGLIVESISSTGVNFSTGYEGYNETPFDQLMPIPLDPEILLKCGETKVTYKGVNYLSVGKLPEPLYLVISGNHICLSMRQDVFPEFVDLQARAFYLHQLQNLYYCLTGEELMFEFPTK